MKLPSGTQFKSLAFDVKTIDADQGIVTGYLSTFGNIDEQSDRVIRGAFKKTIADALSRKMTGRKFLWPMLWMHDPTQAIGLFIDAKEDEHGLFVTAQLDVSCNVQGHPNNPIATRVFSGFKIGYVDEMSIGYRPILADYTKVDNQQVRDLKEIQLVEGSAVTSLFAADPLALVTGVKSTATPQRLAIKTFDEHYREECCENLLECLDDVLLCSLKSSIMDAITIGDTPNTDITQSLSAFGTALTEWVASAVKYDLCAYIASQDTPDDDDAPRPLLNTMSKAGARISATTRAALQDHVDTLHDHADKEMANAKMLYKYADGLTQLWEEQGRGDPYAEPTKESNGPDAQKRREPHTALTREVQPAQATDDAELSDALAKLASLSTLKY